MPPALLLASAGNTAFFVIFGIFVVAMIVLAVIVIMWAVRNDLAGEVTERIMQAYFEEGRDIGDTEELVRLGVEAGLSEREARAAVVLREGYHLTAEELRAHCADHLARHKIPRNIWFMTDALPRNANGKFLKRELREKLGTMAAA